MSETEARRSSKADHVYRDLKESILSGALEPGGAIDKLELCERLGDVAVSGFLRDQPARLRAAGDDRAAARVVRRQNLGRRRARAPDGAPRAGSRRSPPRRRCECRAKACRPWSAICAISRPRSTRATSPDSTAGRRFSSAADLATGTRAIAARFSTDCARIWRGSGACCCRRPGACRSASPSTAPSPKRCRAATPPALARRWNIICSKRRASSRPSRKNARACFPDSLTPIGTNR